MRGCVPLENGYFCHLVIIFALWANYVQEANAQMTQVYQNQESALTNLNKNITILRSFLVPSSATYQNKLTDNSKLTKIEMHVIISSAFKWSTPTFPLVSLKQSVEIKDKEKDLPHIDVKVSAMLLNNVSNVRSMNTTIVSNVYPGLDVKTTRGFPMKLNYQLAWIYSGMKSFSVGYNATPTGTTKSIYRTNFKIRDYQQRLLNEFYEPVNTFFCLNPIKVVKQNYEHGYNMVICLVGFLLALLAMLLFQIIKQHYQCNDVSFINDDSTRYREQLILTPIVPSSNYQYTSQAYHKTETSIVNVLTMERVQIDREIINRDLSYTERLEKDMEKAWCNGSSEIVISLVRNMENSKHITAELARKAISSFKSKITEMERELEAFYQSKLLEIQKKISARNQNKIAELKANREKIISNAKKKNYRPEVISMLEEEEEVKIQNAIAELQLNQREEIASLNKDIDSQRRVNYKNMQKNMLQLIRENSDMDQERQEWFMRENQKKQYEWSNQIEQNILKQQLALEEKLAKQEALVQQTDSQDLDYGELLDSIANQQISILKKFKKEKIIPQNEAKIFIEGFMNKLKTVKNEYDDKKIKEAKELDQKLYHEKIASLDDIQAKHKLELEELEKKYRKEAQDGKADPLDHMTEKQELESQHRLALVEAESELDIKHAQQLQDMREKLMIETKKELNSLQDELIDNMKEKGASEDFVDNMLGIHKKAMNAFEQEQLKNQKRQDDLIQETLARKKEERKRKAEEEKNSQKQIQNYEENLVKELLDNQLAMSENNRDKILEEHEKQMIKLDNSMMINKIRQQQMLEKRLAKKREEKMRMLLEKQESERSSHQPTSEEVEDVDDSRLIEKHVKERLAVMQESMNRSDALEEIKTTLNRERAEALKQQEEKMGALVAKMKLDKIKESCEIEEKERAIFKLKANLIEELQSNGNLEDSECSEMIDKHNQQIKAYRQQQEEEKKKQEEMLRENLQKQMLKRQATMMQKNETEIENALKNSHDNVASKLKGLVLKNKQMMEMEKLRNDLTREMNQVLEEKRQKHQLEIKQQLQEQEFQLVTQLIKLGKLKRNEMEKAMHMLLPGKSQEEIAELLNKIIGEDTDESETRQVNFTSSFELRVREVFLETRNGISRKERKRIKEKKHPLSHNKADDLGEENEHQNQPTPNKLKPLGTRPMRINLQADSNDGVDPDKEFRNPKFYNNPNYYYENQEPTPSISANNGTDVQMKRSGVMLPPVRLAPIEDTMNTPKKKKKKKSELRNRFDYPEI